MKLQSNPQILKKMAGKEGLQLSHLSLTELDSLKNLGYLPADINIKQYHSFEKKIVANAKEIYAVQNNKSLALPEKRAEIAKLQKIDRALRKDFPKYADTKARLKVRASNLELSGLKIGEKLPNPAVAISQTEGTFLKDIKTGSQKEKDLLELSKESLEAKIKELGGKEKMSKLLATGTGSIEERNLIRQVIKTGFDFAKATGKVTVNLLNPKEFFSLRSLVGKEAMALMAGVEVVDVADRWIRQGIPIKEALGEKWTKHLMPRSLEEYQTEGMNEANALNSPASKRYAKNIDLSNDLIRTYDKLEMLEKGEAAKIKGTSDVERIANLKKSITAKEKEYSEFINQKDKDGNVLGDGELDFKKDYNEYRAQTKTRRDFTDLDIFGGMNDMGTDKMSGLQIDRTYTPMYKIGTSKIPSEQELAFDATLAAQPHIRKRLIAPSTSKNFNYTPQKLPVETRQEYENLATEKGILDPSYPPRSSLSQTPMPDGSTYDYLTDLTELYNNSQKAKQASMYPDFYGSQFSEGGLANLMKKYYDKR